MIDTVIADLLHDVADHVYMMAMPQQTEYPAVLFRRMGEKRQHTLDGALHTTEYAYDIVTWAETYEAARTLGDSIRDALDAVTGTDDEASYLLLLGEGSDEVWLNVASPMYRDVIHLRAIVM